LEGSDFGDIELSINNWTVSFDKVAKIIICEFGDGHTEEKDGGCFKEKEEHGDFLSELDQSGGSDTKGDLLFPDDFFAARTHLNCL
jgi:hypothetical protein